MLFLLLTMADIPAADEPPDVLDRAPRDERWKHIATIKLKESNAAIQEAAG
jgi:hypothetical protein